MRLSTTVRRLLVLTAAATVWCSAASSASAATLGVSGGTLYYEAAPGLNSDVVFSGGENVLYIHSFPTRGGDPITSSSCRQSNYTLPDTTSTYECYGVTEVVVNAGDGDDTVAGNGPSLALYVPLRAFGGPGVDDLTGGMKRDVLDGGSGSDALNGWQDADTLNGGPAADALDGFTGDDALNGGDGDDALFGNDGKDLVDGGAGDDLLENAAATPLAGCGDPGRDNGDVYRGGSGRDTFVSLSMTYSCEFPPGPSGVATPVDVSLDGQANDGVAGEADDVASDVEDVTGNQAPPFDPASDATGGDSDDALTGSDGLNTLTGLRGDDTLDGGRGNDVLDAGEGDDTVNARDGFADFVACGPGTDVATVDAADSVNDCETVKREDTGTVTPPAPNPPAPTPPATNPPVPTPPAPNPSAPTPPATTPPGGSSPAPATGASAQDAPLTTGPAREDAPPSIALTAPVGGSKVGTTRPTLLTATASDDTGVGRVLFLANGRIVCAATAAPWSCPWTPTNDDVGRTTLTAIAVDAAQQTSLDVRSVLVDRFVPTRLTQRVTTGRATTSALRFAARGALSLPAAVRKPVGCTGVVSIQVKAGSTTVATRRAALRADCTYSSSVTFTSRKGFGKARKLTFTARFAGNAVVAPRTYATTVRVRPG